MCPGGVAEYVVRHALVRSCSVCVATTCTAATRECIARVEWDLQADRSPDQKNPLPATFTPQLNHTRTHTHTHTAQLPHDRRSLSRSNVLNIIPL